MSLGAVTAMHKRARHICDASSFKTGNPDSQAKRRLRGRETPPEILVARTVAVTGL
jgi:hypothetical protein